MTKPTSNPLKSALDFWPDLPKCHTTYPKYIDDPEPVHDPASSATSHPVSSNPHPVSSAPSPTALNALKHGIWTNKILINTEPCSEDPAEFTALRQSFIDDLKPIGPTEHLLVETIVTSHWRLRQHPARQVRRLSVLTRPHLRSRQNRR